MWQMLAVSLMPWLQEECLGVVYLKRNAAEAEVVSGAMEKTV